MTCFDKNLKLVVYTEISTIFNAIRFMHAGVSNTEKNNIRWC